MDKVFQATYEQGVLRLDAPLSLPEQARVIGHVTIVTPPGESDASHLSVEDFERVLDEFSVHSNQSLPADFSRADIYLDHD